MAKSRRVAIAVRLPAATHRRLTQAAGERDVSINWLVNRAVVEFLDRLIPVEEFTLTRDRKGGS